MTSDGLYPVYGANGVIGRFDSYNHDGLQLLLTCRGATCGRINISKGRCWINGNAMVIKPNVLIIDFEFLKYWLQLNGKSESIISGSAQPQITRQSLDLLQLSLPPMNEQKRIVAKIEELYSCLDNIEASLQS